MTTHVKPGCSVTSRSRETPVVICECEERFMTTKAYRHHRLDLLRRAAIKGATVEEMDFLDRLHKISVVG